MVLMRVQNLDVRQDKRRVIANLSFEIRAAERFAILGDAGDDLTELARVLLGLQPRKTHVMGRITLMGEDLLALKERQWCSVRGGRLGYVPRDLSAALTPTHAIGAQIEEHIYLHRPGQNAESIARRLMQRVGLGHVPPDTPGGALTGEARLRAALAIAVACTPRLLVFAYPTEGLARQTRLEIHSLLKEMVEDDGMSLLFLTQDVSAAEDLATRVLVMEAGAVVETAPATQLARSTRDPRTRARVAAVRPEMTWPEVASPGAEETPLLLDAKDVCAGGGFGRGSFGGGKRRLDGVRFEIRVGARVGLVSDARAAVDTLVACMLGQQRPRQGVMRLKGQRVGRQTRGQVQVVRDIEAGRFDPRAPVHALIGAPLTRLRSRPDKLLRAQRIEKAMETWGIAASLRRARVGDLPLEVLCRVALARAMISKPALLILDQTFRRLPPLLRAEMVGLLASRCEATALLWISHDLAFLSAVSERVMVLKDGRILEDGPGAEGLHRLTDGAAPREAAQPTLLVQEARGDAGTHLV